MASENNNLEKKPLDTIEEDINERRGELYGFYDIDDYFIENRKYGIFKKIVKINKSSKKYEIIKCLCDYPIRVLSKTEYNGKEFFMYEFRGKTYFSNLTICLLELKNYYRGGTSKRLLKLYILALVSINQIFY